MCANTSWYLANFRLSLCSELMQRGFEVYVVAPLGDGTGELERIGVRCVDVRMSASEMKIHQEAFSIFAIHRALRHIKPDLCLTYTTKANVYFGMLCGLLKIPTIMNVSGLGRVFIDSSFHQKLLVQLYRHAQKSAIKVYFQNEDDLRCFVAQRVVSIGKVGTLPGSGVDTKHFCGANEKTGFTERQTRFRFLMSARLIWEKGVAEYVEAATRIHEEGLEVDFLLMGQLGGNGSSSVSQEWLINQARLGIIEYVGCVSDVRPVLASSDCFVLPSYYREGVPRVILEASSMGLPVITTDSVGCRDAVDHGSTGYLCKPRDCESLVHYMRELLFMSAQERAEMGHRGRAKMVTQFDEEIVINEYLKTVQQNVSNDSFSG